MYMYIYIILQYGICVCTTALVRFYCSNLFDLFWVHCHVYPRVSCWQNKLIPPKTCIGLSSESEGLTKINLMIKNKI